MADMNSNQPQVSTPRMQALQNLSSQLPVANQQIAQGQQAARDIQLQQAVSAAPSSPTGSGNPGTAQQIGAQQAQTAGSQMIQNAQQGIQKQGQVGQLGLQEQSRQGQSDVASQEMGARQQQMDNVQRLAALSASAKKEVYDDNLQFQKDELGRAQFNQTQLADYARVNARNQNEYQNYAQQANQLSQRKLQVMEASYQKINEDIQQKQRVAEQTKDEASMKQLAQMKRDADLEMQRQRNAAANNAAMWQAGGAVAGGVAGAVVGGPAGAAAGASVGSAVGGFASTQTQ